MQCKIIKPKAGCGNVDVGGMVWKIINMTRAQICLCSRDSINSCTAQSDMLCVLYLFVYSSTHCFKVAILKVEDWQIHGSGISYVSYMTLQRTHISVNGMLPCENTLCCCKKFHIASSEIWKAWKKGRQGTWWVAANRGSGPNHGFFTYRSTKQDEQKKLSWFLLYCNHFTLGSNGCSAILTWSTNALLRILPLMHLPVNPWSFRACFNYKGAGRRSQTGDMQRKSAYTTLKLSFHFILMSRS